MTSPDSTNIMMANNKMKPLEFENVKLMSMGFISKGAAIMRGPMVNQVSLHKEILRDITHCKYCMAINVDIKSVRCTL
jgi:hypothetical protein